jgi:predicted enzyme related to lactoylglutathione lyase
LKRVTGIGGVFFSASDPVALRAWYKKHLGIDVQDWGGTGFTWADASGKPTTGTTVWCIGPADGKQFAPSKSTFMVNYRVDDLAALLQALRDEGCHVLEKTSDDPDFGKFGWVMDPEGNKIELWQPPAGQ